MNAEELYAMTLPQVSRAILAGNAGSTISTVLAQGHTGVGKSSLLGLVKDDMASDYGKALGYNVDEYEFVYFDVTTKDAGDVFIPNVVNINQSKTGVPYVSFIPNEEFGLHLGKKLVIMIDEWGKNPAILNPLNRLALEQQLGNYKLPEGSIVFGTTNLSAEGVGDFLPMHMRNRITIVNIKKQTNKEWLTSWAMDNGIHPVVMGYVNENEQLMHSFTEVKDPDENLHIYHPQAPHRQSFTTNRSLAKASNWMWAAEKSGMTSDELSSLLIGTVGEATAMGLMTFKKMADKLPSLDSIKQTPDTAMIPESSAATIMMVMKAIQIIDNDWINAWMVYLQRLPIDAQGLFIQGIITSKNEKRKQVCVTNAAFGKFMHENNHLFAVDQ